ncbi:hypothetical protein [Pelagibius sp.]|uniref:hypothetical protein n=1 Tax=Pelagibius sp. TaxID=1931238 RepID=UPI0026361679|nr:hypothetical protein [Pelagibius sp.]
MSLKTAIAAITLSLGLALTMGQGAAAQDGSGAALETSSAPGMLNTQSFKPLPDGIGIHVAPYDDNELNLLLKEDFEAQLTAQERAEIKDDAEARFLLLFEAKVVPTEDLPQGPSLGSARAGSTGVDVNVNVWSSTQDSVLGGRQGSQEIGSSSFHINATLRDRESREVIWQGDAYHLLLAPDTERIARSMVPPLVERLGRSASHEPFDIQ